MKWRLLFLVILIVSLAAGSGCLRDSEYKINRQDAIDIAVKQLPESLREADHGGITLYDENNWNVNFMLGGTKPTLTREELGWAEGPGTTFENQGTLPEDEYRLIVITVSRRTGEVVKRLASDTILLGGPGMFNNEPPEERYLPGWVLALVVICGVGIGAAGVWLFMRRKKESNV